MNFTIKLPRFLGSWIAHCMVKVDYKSEGTAKSACTAMAKKGVRGLEPYRCRQCKGWHIGHRHGEQQGGKQA